MVAAALALFCLYVLASPIPGLLMCSHPTGSLMEIVISTSQPVAAASFQRVAESHSLKVKHRSRLTAPAAPFQDSKGFPTDAHLYL
jgi:hypothetical protein